MPLAKGNRPKKTIEEKETALFKFKQALFVLFLIAIALGMLYYYLVGPYRIHVLGKPSAFD